MVTNVPRWKRPGRGRRLRCQVAGPRGTTWHLGHLYKKNGCPVCGAKIWPGEIGVIESFRFITDLSTYRLDR